MTCMVLQESKHSMPPVSQVSSQNPPKNELAILEIAIKAQPIVKRDVNEHGGHLLESHELGRD